MKEPCPCGGGAYVDCCGPLHLGAPAVSAEQLMRARYSAFARHDADFLFRSWHPRTRPEHVDAGEAVWFGLEILDVVDGGPDDTAGIVEFLARSADGDLRERSRFERRAGRWVYVNAE